MSSPESPTAHIPAENGALSPHAQRAHTDAGEQISARLLRAIPDLPWMRFEVGERIVIRYRLADGLHDALGEALEVAPTHVTHVRQDVVGHDLGQRVLPALEIVKR